MNLKLGLVGKGHQGQRYLDPVNWPTGVEVVPFDHAPRSVRGVIVATPADKHHEFALFAMEKLKLPVLVEKPTHANPLIGMEMVKVSRRTKVPLYTAFPHWFSETLRNPYLAGKDDDITITWRGPENGDCSAVVDWGSHAFSIKYMTDYRANVCTGAATEKETTVRIGNAVVYTGEIESPTQMCKMLGKFSRLVATGHEDKTWEDCQGYVLGELEELLKCVS